VGFAAWAIHRSSFIARNADDVLVRERRLTFELGVLERLAEACGYYTAGSANVVRGLLRLLPDEDVPDLRRAVEVGDTLPSQDLLAGHLKEYPEAVDRRIHERSITGLPLAGRRVGNLYTAEFRSPTGKGTRRDWP
jgi:hypothetical protein